MVSIFHATNASALNHLRMLMQGFVAWHHTTHPEDGVLIERYFPSEAFERELADLPGPYVLRPFWPVRDHALETARAYAGAGGFRGGYDGRYNADHHSVHRLREVPPPAAVSGLLIAYHGGAPAGCVALRDRGQDSTGTGVCEMKRLFVPASFRGMGVGRALVRRAIAEATQAGYGCMRLATSRRQVEAIRLFEKNVFERVPPEDALPMELASWLIFFERRL